MKFAPAAIVLAAASIATLLSAGSAAAASTEPAESTDDVTWSVRPGDQNGEDGRSWVEWEADPGDEQTEHMVVTNHGDADVEFQLSAADGYFTDTGRFNMLPSDEESIAAGAWIDLPESITVPSGAAEVVPFTVTVPDNATPGDHAAGVAASIRSTGDGVVGVESRVGFRVMTRVEGELQPQLAVDASGSYSGEVNPFSSGSVDVAYEVENTGNTLLRAQPEIALTGPFGVGSQRVAGDEIVELAPGETRRGTVRVSDAWPLITYDASVTATPLPVSDDLGFEAAEPVTAEASILAMPWSQLVVLALALVLVTWSVWRRRIDKKRTERLIATAREEALAEAGAGGGDRPHADLSRARPITP